MNAAYVSSSFFFAEATGRWYGSAYVHRPLDEWHLACSTIPEAAASNCPLFGIARCRASRLGG